MCELGRSPRLSTTLPRRRWTHAAIREFHEETGHRPLGPFRPLAPQRTKSGKVIQAWVTLDGWDGTGFVSNYLTGR